MISLSLLLVAALQTPVATPTSILAQKQSGQTVRAGTSVRLLTESDLDSRSIRQGQRIRLRLADDVVVNSVVVLPGGTPAVGEIESLTGKGMFGEAARFALRPLFIELEHRRINLTGMHHQSGSSAVGPAVVTTVLTGGLGLYITGKSATLAKGSVIHGELREDLLLGHR